MSAPSWIGVQVSMESVKSAAKVITALTNATVGVSTSTAHGFANGDLLLVEAQGMNQVNSRMFRAAGVTANTFNLEGEDTTLYGIFSSGNAYKLTMGVSFSTLQNVTGSGGEFDKLDATTIDRTEKVTELGLASALEFSFDSLWDLADAGLIAAIAASKQKIKKGFLITFPDGKKALFYGNVGASGIPGGSAGQKVTTKVAISASGVPTYYLT